MKGAFAVLVTWPDDGEHTGEMTVEVGPNGGYTYCEAEDYARILYRSDRRIGASVCKTSAARKLWANANGDPARFRMAARRLAPSVYVADVFAPGGTVPVHTTEPVASAELARRHGRRWGAQNMTAAAEPERVGRVKVRKQTVYCPHCRGFREEAITKDAERNNQGGFPFVMCFDCLNALATSRQERADHADQGRASPQGCGS